MKIKIKLRSGKLIVANSYGFGAVGADGKFYHRSSYALVQVLEGKE